MTTHAVAAANTAAPADPSPAPRPPRPPPTVADGDAAILDINGDRQALVWVKKNGCEGGGEVGRGAMGAEEGGG